MFYRIERLGHLLHDASRAFRRRFEARAARFGLSATQWRLLGHVLREGPLTQAQLADRLDVEPISVSRLVDRMAQAGWVQRLPHPADRRARIVQPTQQAQEAAAEVRVIAEDLADEVLAPFTPTERRLLHDLLLALTDGSGRPGPLQPDDGNDERCNQP